MAHEEGNLNDLRAILGNDVAIKAYREGSCRSRMARSLPGWPGVMFHRKKTTKSLAVANLFVPGPRTGLVSSAYGQGTQENTPRRAAGVSLNLIKTANLPTKRCTKPASPATSLAKLATLSSPVALVPIASFISLIGSPHNSSMLHREFVRMDDAHWQ